AITLYLCRKKIKFLWIAGLFLVLLVLSSSMKELGVIFAVFLVLLRALNSEESNVSSAGKRLLFVAMISAPLLAFVFGAALDKLITSRVDLYVLEENARAALHVKSAEIATDYFPLGSGAGTYS